MSSTPLQDSQYVVRAMAAYYRSDAQSLAMAPVKDLPNHQLSKVREEDGLRYVFLRSYERVLVIYRIDNADRLKRLKRWPRGIDGWRARDQLRNDAAVIQHPYYREA